MKKVFDFVWRERQSILSLFLLVLCSVFGSAGVMLADATVVPPVSPSATPGGEGLNTQMNGQDGSVTNLSANSDIVEPDLDEEISKFRSDYFPIDTIARRAAQKKKKSNYVVKHYNIDSARVSCETTEAYTEDTTKKKATLKLDANDKAIFQVYDTINVRGVTGYDSKGKTQTPGIDLMLYVVGVAADTDMPIVVAVNGPKVNESDAECYVPTIPANTELYCMSNAGSESQLFCPPANVVPQPAEVYMQRKLINTKFTEYFKNVSKKIAFDDQDIQEAALWEFRRKCELTYLLGVKGRISIKDASLPNRGAEDVYFSEGIWWQVRKFYDYKKGAFTYNDFLAITKMKFTGNNGSKVAFFGVGKDLLEDIHKVDYKLYKELTISTTTKWGIKCTSFESSFGTLNIVHLPILDEAGMRDCGIALDVDYLARYYMDDLTSRELDMAVNGEEATRNVTKQIDCLCLKGYSHLIVRPAADSGAAASAGQIQAKAVTSLPTAPEENEVVYLTVDDGEHKAGQLLRWTGASWTEYKGEVFI